MIITLVCAVILWLLMSSQIHVIELTRPGAPFVISASTFPALAIGIIMVCSAVDLVLQFLKKRREKKQADMVSEADSTDEAAAKAEPIANVKPIILFGFIPINLAASGFCETARIAKPTLVLLTT